MEYFCLPLPKWTDFKNCVKISSSLVYQLGLIYTGNIDFTFLYIVKFNNNIKDCPVT